MARELILKHVDDNVVDQVKSAAVSSSRTGPPRHFKSQPMNAPPQSELLDTTLQDILQFITPTKADFDMRTAIITQLRDVIKHVEGVIVEPYGSFVSNLYTRWSDMDISVVKFSGWKIQSTTNNAKTEPILRQIYEAMGHSALWSGLEFIGNARVPIVKGLSRQHQNIPCDVSIDNVKGLLKSRFLLWIGGIDSRFHDLVLLVKEWAKAHDINNSKNGTFSSYSLCLLVIFHLQFSDIELNATKFVVSTSTGSWETRRFSPSKDTLYIRRIDTNAMKLVKD
ncbi:hypothetical protein Bca101_021600 [Brassica carinata]